MGKPRSGYTDEDILAAKEWLANCPEGEKRTKNAAARMFNIPHGSIGAVLAGVKGTSANPSPIKDCREVCTDKYINGILIHRGNSY